MPPPTTCEGGKHKLSTEMLPGSFSPLGEDYIEGGLSTLQRDFLKQETVNSGNIRFWAGLEPRPATDN